MPKQPKANVPKGPTVVQPSTCDASESVITDASSNKKPLVLLIAKGEGTCFKEGDFSTLESRAIFVKIPWRADKLEESTSPVPTSKLLSANPSAAYNVKGDKPCMLVCDWFGNEYFRVEGEVSVDELTKFLLKVNEEIKDNIEKLQKNFDKAKASRDGGDRKNAIKSILKNFKMDVVGFDPQLATIKVYNEIIEEGRTEAKEKHARNDLEGLKAMQKEFKDTELEPEIAEMLKNPVGADANPTTQDKKEK